LDISSELNSAPVIGATAGAAGGSVQGLNTLQALSSVLQAQNQMIQIWVNFESNRLQIYNFMGTMEIDENGFWVDEFYRRRADAARAGRVLGDLPPAQPSDTIPPGATPPSPPQELKNAPVDATEIAPQPQSADAREPGPLELSKKRSVAPKRDEKIQYVKAETWPERPVDLSGRTSRGGRKATAAPSDPPHSRRGGRVDVGREEELEAVRPERPDRRSR
jgi:hypothetical protein